VCGRFGLTRPDKLDLQRFGVGGVPELKPRFNVPPGTDILVVRDRRGTRVADTVHWGLVPSWARDRSIGYRMVNARADTALTKPSFRNAMERRRCLIPADVFYEWQAVQGDRRKQPWAVALPDGELFALAGLWEYWKPAEGGEGLVTCTILTTDPNTLLEPIHDRMPVIIHPDRYRSWLDPRTPRPAVEDMVRPWPSDELRAWKISHRVNDANADDVEVLQPIAD
jgi:putative SOS response-associated peptidase YedK